MLFFLWLIISRRKLEYCHTNAFIVLAVNIPTTPQETIPTDNERTPEETPNSTEPSVLLPSVFTILGVAVLVVIGALYCRKNRGIEKMIYFIRYRMLPYKGILLKPNTFGSSHIWSLCLSIFLSNSMGFLGDISTRWESHGKWTETILHKNTISTIDNTVCSVFFFNNYSSWSIVVISSEALSQASRLYWIYWNSFSWSLMNTSTVKIVKITIFKVCIFLCLFY